MTDEERNQILNEAAAVLERTQHLKGPSEPVDLSRRDRVDEWRKWHEARDEEQHKAERRQRREEHQYLAGC